MSRTRSRSRSRSRSLSPSATSRSSSGRQHRRHQHSEDRDAKRRGQQRQLSGSPSHDASPCRASRRRHRTYLPPAGPADPLVPLGPLFGPDFPTDHALAPAALSSHLEQPLSAESSSILYGKGFALMAKQGWTQGTGLGRSGTGIATPISVRPKNNVRGIATAAEATALAPRPTSTCASTTETHGQHTSTGHPPAVSGGVLPSVSASGERGHLVFKQPAARPPLFGQRVAAAFRHGRLPQAQFDALFRRPPAQ